MTSIHQANQNRAMNKTSNEAFRVRKTLQSGSDRRSTNLKSIDYKDQFYQSQIAELPQILDKRGKTTQVKK